jgi:hypothetical protein
MKMTKTLSVAVAVAMAFVAGKAVAVNTNSIPVLAMSGTLEVVKTNYVTKSGNNTIQTTAKLSFNNSYIVGIISNALFFAPPAGINPTNIPAKSYIVYNPNGVDPSGLNGIFYVTNQNHFSCPLSGIDTNGDYYSYAELDSDNGGTINGEILGFDLGLSDEDLDDFNYVSAFNQSNITNTETQTTSSTAVFYIHDNPYAYDAADSWAWNFGYGPSAPYLSSPNPSLANFENSIEMQGILVTSGSTDAQGLGKGSGTFTGSGNALVNGNQALILSGKVTVTGVVSLNGE